MEKPSASKTAAPAEKKAEPKGEAKPAAKAAASKPGASGSGAMGAAPAAGGMPGAPAMPDPIAGLKQMLLGPIDTVIGEFEKVKQQLGGGKIGVELDSGDIVIPAAMVGKIPPALRQQFETCVGCSANDLVASKRGQSMAGGATSAGAGKKPPSKADPGSAYNQGGFAQKDVDLRQRAREAAPRVTGQSRADMKGVEQRATSRLIEGGHEQDQ
jgi:hypothetical protein